ncbi:ATP-binding protein [Promicromonospora kroppenstedtii]|uniref:ATP-binding protein n=1 Tax=Promicromonospora kroppenstedtii TaxID=440482 RepID=UPI0004AE5017|nr:ATP-binding protein [Promicromonospora kroppenstedtii]
MIDGLLDELQPHLQATSVYGPKGVGKTETARRRATSVLRLDQANERRRLIADPDLLRTLPGPVLVDEWQRWPESWDRIRRAVDDGAEPGRFLVTGSSAPRGAVVHSGAGRIVGMRMRPMSLSERGLETPTVSLAALLDGGAEVGGETQVVLGDYVEEIVASGYPGIRSAATPRLRRTALDAYIDNIVQREFPDQGYPVRRPEALRAWLAAYAAASSSTAKYVEILDAATPNQGNKPNAKTTVGYRDALAGLWLLDPTPAWMPTSNHLSRLGQATKHQLADPALAARLLNLDADALMTGRGDDVAIGSDSILGALFESLVTLDVQVYAPSSEARVHHLREQDGRHEVDLIVEGLGRRLVAIEIKLTAAPGDRDVRQLLWLKEKLGDALTDMVVINTGRYAYRRQDGVAVIPAALLGP